MAWEFQLGARSWLLPGITAALMEVARLFGDGPDYYVPLIAGATGTPVTLSPTATGTLYYCYRVTDASNGNPVLESAYSATAVTVQVYPTLSAAGAPACADFGAGLWTGTSGTCSGAKAGDHITLTATPSGGNPSLYSYVWRNGTSSVCGSDPVMAGATGPTLNVIVASTPGTYYCYGVNDGSQATPALSPTYFLDPSSAAPAASTPVAAAAPAAGSRP